MTDNQRFIKITDWLKENRKIFNNADLACILGVSQTYVSLLSKGKKPLTESIVNNLINKFTEISKDWLLEEKGSMLIPQNATASSVQEIEQKTALNKSDVVLIPVLNLDVRGGYSDNENTDIREYVDGMIPFSNKIARNGDFVIPLFGDSMYPRYPSGSQLLVRPVENWRDYLELGNSYVIELNDGRRIVKIVKKGSDKDHFLLVSVNPDFEPQEIPVSIIEHVFLVKMMLKKEGA